MAWCTTVHNSNVKPLYVRDKFASEPLTVLANTGSPADFVDWYTANHDGVNIAEVCIDGIPVFLVDEVAITVEVGGSTPLLPFSPWPSTRKTAS